MLRVSYLNSGWHTVIHITGFLARGELLTVVLDGELMFCHQLTPTRETAAVQIIENMVARDGVEPPTPAFSGLRSTT